MHSKELRTEMLMEEVESKLTLIGSSGTQPTLPSPLCEKLTTD
jgi:hypothetical protein